MSQIIEITGATGSGTYDVYLCDITLTYCFLISASTIIPPDYSFELPSSLPNPSSPPPTVTFAGTTSVIIKLVDVNTLCEKFMVYDCGEPPTTTTTTTI